jgi:hypothetical protein
MQQVTDAPTRNETEDLSWLKHLDYITGAPKHNWSDPFYSNETVESDGQNETR